MLQVKYKNDGTCQRNGTLIFRVYAADRNLLNVYFNLNSQGFFRGSSKERGIFLPFIAANSYEEFVIPFRGARSFNSPQASFKVEIQCSVKYNGEDVPLRWDGDFTRDIAIEQSSVTNNTYHVENNTTVTAADSGIAYIGKSSNDYSGLQDNDDDSAKVEFVEVDGTCRRAAELCTKPVLVKIDTGKDLERGAQNELTIYFDPCIPGGKNWQFTMKKATGSLLVGGKKLTFSQDSFFEQPCQIGMFPIKRSYCRIPIDLPEKVSQIYLSQLICSGEMGDDVFCFSTPQKYECELLAPLDPEFSDVEDLGLLPMVPAEEKDHLSTESEETANPVNAANTSPAQIPLQDTPAQVTIQVPITNPVQTVAAGTNAGLQPDVLSKIQIDTYEDEKEKAGRAAEFQKACQLFGTFGNGLNPEYAFPVFLKEYEAGTENHVAVEKLAECYLLGIGTRQDLSQGLKLMKHAADAGNAEAMLHYAECCLSGTGMVKNADAGKKYLLASANAGNRNAMCKLAGLYLAGKLFPRNYAEAKRLYVQADTLDARYAVACMKYFGLAEERNIPAAVEHFAELSNHGHVPSLIMYANCLANGIGIEQDIAQADAICSEIPQKSGVLSGIAYKNAGMMNFRRENYCKAVELLQKAVKNHNAEAAFLLSQKFYNKGIGVSKSSIAAVELLKWASKQNHKKSMLQLAECYLRGIGVYQDCNSAVEILKKFDGSNDPHYLFLMGMCQYHGLGVDEDEAAGLRLLKRSADAGYPPAVEYLEDVEL